MSRRKTWTCDGCGVASRPLDGSRLPQPTGWAEGVEALRRTFRETTIADIAAREGAGQGMYYI